MKRPTNRRKRTNRLRGRGKHWNNLYLEYNKGKSHKFWEITRDNTKITTRWGKLGAKGRELTKNYEFQAEAKKQYQAKIDAKKKKGYISHWKKPRKYTQKN